MKLCRDTVQLFAGKRTVELFALALHVLFDPVMDEEQQLENGGGLFLPQTVLDRKKLGGDFRVGATLPLENREGEFLQE